jgi:hypothetical protein
MVAAIKKKAGRKTAPVGNGLRQAVGARATRLAAEGCIVLEGVAWETYRHIDKAFGDDSRAGTRLNYLHGRLEIMTTSSDHERVKKIIAHCIEHYCMESDIWFTAQGQMTRQAGRDCAAEADESYSFDAKSRQVDLVLEVCISSGGLEKLSLYEALGRPEVWLWRKGRLQIHVWRNGRYESVKRSSVLPAIPLNWIEELSVMKDDFLAMREFRRRLASKSSKR